jgi:adenosylhomocysteine nucleosidase
MIAVLSAVWDEVEKLGADMDSIEEGKAGDMHYRIGNLYGKNVLLGSTGVGIRRARTGASLVIQRYKPLMIISAGLGGGLSRDLKVGDVIVGESVISLRKNESKKLYCEVPEQAYVHRRGDIITENRFVNEPALKSDLFNLSGALVVDMETWGVAEAALQSETPVMSVRSVSDESWERLPDMGAIYDASGRLALRKAFPYFLYRPSLISPYLRFRRVSYKRALDSLSLFIGRFLRHSNESFDRAN